METVELEIEMSNELIAETHDLAVRYFGDDSDVSLARIVEIAFRMRRLWSGSIEKGQDETEEAITQWQFPESLTSVDDNDDIRRWLFRR